VLLMSEAYQGSVPFSKWHVSALNVMLNHFSNSESLGKNSKTLGVTLRSTSIPSEGGGTEGL